MSPVRLALLAAGIASALTLGLAIGTHRDAPAEPPSPAPTAAAEAPRDARPATPASLAIAVAAEAAASAPPAPASTPRTPAQIVADARLHGDERAPPIDAADAEPPPATPWEVADPDLYQAREQRMTAEMHARFAQASEQRLVTLRAAVERLRAEGVSPELLAMAEDKVRHLQATHDAVVRGESLAASR